MRYIFGLCFIIFLLLAIFYRPQNANSRQDIAVGMYFMCDDGTRYDSKAYTGGIYDFDINFFENTVTPFSFEVKDNDYSTELFFSVNNSIVACATVESNYTFTDRREIEFISDGELFTASYRDRFGLQQKTGDCDVAFKVDVFQSKKTIIIKINFEGEQAVVVHQKEEK